MNISYFVQFSEIESKFLESKEIMSIIESRKKFINDSPISACDDEASRILNPDTLTIL